MTVKSSVSFTDKHHQFATKKVQEDESSSVSSVVAAGLELLMQDEREREVALTAMSGAIRSRLETPRSDFLEGTEDLFAKAKKRLGAKQ